MGKWATAKATRHEPPGPGVLAKLSAPSGRLPPSPAPASLRQGQRRELLYGQAKPVHERHLSGAALTRWAVERPMRAPTKAWVPASRRRLHPSHRGGSGRPRCSSLHHSRLLPRLCHHGRHLGAAQRRQAAAVDRNARELQAAWAWLPSSGGRSCLAIIDRKQDGNWYEAKVLEWSDGGSRSTTAKARVQGESGGAHFDRLVRPCPRT